MNGSGLFLLYSCQIGAIVVILQVRKLWIVEVEQLSTITIRKKHVCLNLESMFMNSHLSFGPVNGWSERVRRKCQSVIPTEIRPHKRKHEEGRCTPSPKSHFCCILSLFPLIWSLITYSKTYLPFPKKDSPSCACTCHPSLLLLLLH